MSNTEAGHCISCKEPFSDKNVFTKAGWREINITQMCEACFDKTCDEGDKGLEKFMDPDAKGKPMELRKCLVMKWEEVAMEDVKKGDILRILPASEEDKDNENGLNIYKAKEDGKTVDGPAVAGVMLDTLYDHKKAMGIFDAFGG